MCVHYIIEKPEAVSEMAKYAAEEIEMDRFQDDLHEFHAWPKAEMPVVIHAEKRVLTKMRWGVWPWYVKTKPSSFVTNARDDGLLSKSIWKGAVAEGRCLIPADGFYEFAGEKGAKWEVRFGLRSNRPFFFAGVWTKDPVGEGRGFSMVTCSPNSLLASIEHDRMPVILPPLAAMEWVGNMPLPEGRVSSLCVPYDSADMTQEAMPRRGAK